MGWTGRLDSDLAAFSSTTHSRNFNTRSPAVDREAGARASVPRDRHQQQWHAPQRFFFISVCVLWCARPAVEGTRDRPGPGKPATHVTGSVIFGSFAQTARTVAPVAMSSGWRRTDTSANPAKRIRASRASERGRAAVGMPFRSQQSGGNAVDGDGTRHRVAGRRSLAG